MATWQVMTEGEFGAVFEKAMTGTGGTRRRGFRSGDLRCYARQRCHAESMPSVQRLEEVGMILSAGERDSDVFVGSRHVRSAGELSPQASAASVGSFCSDASTSGDLGCENALVEKSK